MSLVLTGTSTGGTIASSTSGVAVQMQDSAANSNTCQVWANFGYVSSAMTTRASFNVSSVTRSGTGIYQINFVNSLIDANYVVTGIASYNNTTGTNGRTVNTGTMSTSSCVVNTAYVNNVSEDEQYVLIAIFR